VSVGKTDAKRTLGIPRGRWEDNIKMDLQELFCLTECVVCFGCEARITAMNVYGVLVEKRKGTDHLDT
jgi:hypothetical protein